ncbi:hypothetical protein B566_EDAN014375 [Ephemera danica]|nr:hypothetical protein B566_EDAN014375 [Ephemera danica]
MKRRASGELQGQNDKLKCPYFVVPKQEPMLGENSESVGIIEEDEESFDCSGSSLNNTSTKDEDNWEVLDNNSAWNQLREFDVLDEFSIANEDNANGEEDMGSSSDDDDDDDDEEPASDGSYDSEVPIDEIDSMLEEEKGRNHFDVLPEGWVCVTHNSGMPVYLHKKSRVCTLAMPYFLGPGSARKHEVPLSSIPCLQYKKALEKEQNQHQQQISKQDIPNGDQMRGLPSAKIETVQENRVSHSLDSTQVRDYCLKLFNFKTIRVMRFPSWSARRQYTKHKKHLKQLHRPSLPEGTKLITFPIQPLENTEGTEGGGIKGKKEWVMNPSGKSYVCILHEYVQHALKKQPAYEFKELENAATPYSATVVINEMQYGQGFGTSKKQAKSEAAKATLEILIPEMRDKIEADKNKAKPSNKEPDLCFFDEIKIVDPRVAELCAKTCEPSPYAILLTCLQRNFRLGNMSINYDVNNSRHQKNEYTMTVGKHTTTVICKNKRDGKQRASQAILQALHPHVSSWGSLLRMYGSRSVKSIKEKKQEEQEITLLQSKAAVNSPNFAILNKLKTEMRNLYLAKKSVQPIGKFVPPIGIGMPSSSGADLNNVDL